MIINAGSKNGRQPLVKQSGRSLETGYKLIPKRGGEYDGDENKASDDAYETN